jgi:hypothetical protein
MVADESSNDKDGWRNKERDCIDHRAAFDVHHDIFMHTTNFMHESCLHMDKDHVGKLEDLYLWSSGT